MNLKPKRKINGMKKCHEPCVACPFVLECKQVSGENFKWKISDSVNSPFSGKVKHLLTEIIFNDTLRHNIET